MKLHKHILKSDWFMSFMAKIVSGYIRFVYYSSRWQHINRQSPEKYWNHDKPFICAFWHNRILMNPCGWNPKKPLNMLISKHSDGKLISRTIENFGVKTVAGSKSKGGLAALRGLLKALKSGECVGITPDGPRGPRFKISDGVMMVAKLSGHPIIPGCYGIKRRTVMGSWDKFIVGLPFTKGVFVWGEPLFVPRDADEETLKKLKIDLTQRLCDISNKADHLCGHAPLD